MCNIHSIINTYFNSEQEYFFPKFYGKVMITVISSLLFHIIKNLKVSTEILNKKLYFFTVNGFTFTKTPQSNFVIQIFSVGNNDFLFLMYFFVILCMFTKNISKVFLGIYSVIIMYVLFKSILHKHISLSNCK